MLSNSSASSVKTGGEDGGVSTFEEHGYVSSIPTFALLVVFSSSMIVAFLIKSSNVTKNFFRHLHN